MLLTQKYQLFRMRNELFKLYHTEKTVYGYRPKEIKDFKVSDDALQFRQKQSNFYRFVSSYRENGHKIASINPVEFKNIQRNLTELNPYMYGLAENDTVNFEGILNVPGERSTVLEVMHTLRKIYCGPVSYEFSYLQTEAEREWFANEIEKSSTIELSNSEKLNIAKEMLKSQAWDNFLATKFPMVKRYGGEGAESMMAFFIEIFERSVEDQIENIVSGMPHRGRLNLLTGLLQCQPAKIFRKFKGLPEFPAETQVMCDIASHFGVADDIKIGNKSIHFNLLNNPSHLEIVNPISMGKTRSKQMTLNEGGYSYAVNSVAGDKVLNLQLHGDAAFTGQGVNQECLMLSQAPNFDIGGSIHMIVNNQVGFTTPADRGRSSPYCSDLAKCISAPVIHVNADYPELVVKATRLAFGYQRQFRKDIFIDLNCYRRWGHNELDDPTFTNPSLYNIIQNRKSIPDQYTESLVSEGTMTEGDIISIVNEHTQWLQSELTNVDKYEPEERYFEKQWSNMRLAPNAVEKWTTGISINILKNIGLASVTYTDDFNIHPHLLKTYINIRKKRLSEERNIDWATAEALSIGSLLEDGHNVRLSGEDVGRGTFSHRHVMLVDQKTNEIYIPLNHMYQKQKHFLEVANSILSEEAVLGYEYGMAIDNPSNLIIWEAQFGDFFNGAQIVVDTYIASGETKWMTSCGLVILLPHGFDGAGAEHSSCRFERFLQMTDSKENSPDGENVNMQIVNPTTPAQYFHLLRRQMVRDYRKPLIVVAPKILIRLTDATSSLQEMGPGTCFQSVIGDETANPLDVRRVILVSGKHYYALNQTRVIENVSNVAIIRVESLCPFPVLELQEQLSKYKKATKYIWSQEEPRNMGAWSFVKLRFENLLGRYISYSGRATAPSVATGVGSWHQNEAKQITRESLFDMVA